MNSPNQTLHTYLHPFPQENYKLVVGAFIHPETGEELAHYNVYRIVNLFTGVIEHQTAVLPNAWMVMQQLERMLHKVKHGDESLFSLGDDDTMPPEPVLN